MISVGIHITVVPDGVTYGPDGTPVFRLSLALAPKVDPSRGEVTVDLLEWPEKIACLAQHIRIAVADVDPAAANPILSPRYLVAVQRDQLGAHSEDTAKTLWQTIFDNGQGYEAGLRALEENLRKEASPPSPPPASTAQDVGAGSRLAGTFHAAGLAQVAEGIYGGAAAAALSTRREAHGPLDGRAGMAADAPAGGGASAVDAGHPNTQWWRSVYREWLDVSSRPTSGASVAADVPGAAGAARPTYLAAVAAEMASAAMPRNAAVELDAVARPPSARERAAGLATAAAELARRGATPRYWKTGVASSSAPGAAADMAGRSAADLVKRELAAFKIVRGVGKRPARLSDQQVHDADAAAAPRRKLTGIMSFPTLAKYLRMIVDVEVTAVDLAGVIGAAGRGFGAIAAAFGPDAACQIGNGALAPVDSLHWTCYTYRPKAGEVPAYFGPCSTGQVNDFHDERAPLIRDGVIDLRAPIVEANQPTAHLRFALTTVDVSSTILAVVTRAEEINRVIEDGVPPFDIETRLPSAHSRGIALIDAQPTPERQDRKLGTTHAVQLSFAEDLLLGYRIDAAVAEGSTWRDRARWRSLVGRDVRYDPRDVPAAFARLPAVEAASHREDGHVRYSRGTTKYTEPDGRETTVSATFQTLATWTGESLAVPSLHQARSVNPDNPDERTVIPRPESDLAIGITYDLPSAPASGKVQDDRRPAPLREGEQYVFGARAFFVNGCGPDLDTAHPLYARSTHASALGDEHGQPYPFRRRTEISAPDVCLAWNDPLVRAAQPDRVGDAVDTLVIREGETTGPVRRVLMPARTTFELSEQGGVFDFDDVEDRPAGAFTSAVRVLMDPETGALPIARNGSWAFNRPLPPVCAAPSTPPPTPPPENGTSRGSVVVLGDRSAQTHEVPFYPDPLARQVCARFTIDTTPASDFGPPATPVAFWDGERPELARPILFELIAGSGTDMKKTGVFQSPPEETRVPSFRGPSPRLRTLQVVLEPGEKVDVELWSSDTPSRVRSRHWTLQRAIDLSGDPAVDDTTLARLLEIAPFAPLQNVRRVHLVHAIAKPRTTPAIVQLHPVVVRLRAAQPTPPGAADELPREIGTWLEYTQLHARELQASWPSEEQGSVTFFVGQIDIHRPSTGRVRCEAQWKEYGEDSVRPDPARQGYWVYAPVPHQERLFAIDRILTTVSPRNRAVDLLKIDAPEPGDQPPGDLRSLAHAFRDGKARKLSVAAIATSRYTAYFTTRGAPPPPDDGRHDRRSPEVPVWVPATFRPQPPEIDRVLPAFHWTEQSSPDGRSITWSRESFLRLYLKRRTWHSTGEGERLAVLFEKAPAQAPDTLCAFEQRVDKFSSFLARWGSDPIHLSGPMNEAGNPLLKPSRFRKAEGDWSWGYVGSGPQQGELLLPLGPDPIVTAVVPTCTGDVRAGTELTITGEHFGTCDGGVIVKVNRDQAEILECIDPTRIKIRTTKPTTCPLLVTAENAKQPVTIREYEPQFDESDGTFHCDIGIHHGQSFFPFVQLGLARYQEHSVAGLELSAPTAAWAQIPPKRHGSVQIGRDRSVEVILRGVGFHAYGQGNRPVADRPRIYVRLMRAAHPERAPAAVADTGWLPVVDDGGRTIGDEAIALVFERRDEQVGTVKEPETETVNESVWRATFQMPRERGGIRYGVLIEEFALMAADPDEPSEYACAPLPNRTALHGPLFSHVVYIGE